MAVEFIEESHTYRSVNDKDINWVSGTGLVKMFKSEFDSVPIAAKCSANKQSKWYGIAPEEILKIWDNESKRSTDIGTWYHNMREDELLSQNTVERNGKEIPVVQINYKDKIKQAHNIKLTDGVYPELFVYDEKMNVCGQADWVEIYDGKLYMYDYKTNKTIDTKPYISWDGKRKKMSAPIDNIDDCNFYHYALQLSIYIFIILRNNPLLELGAAEIHHVTFDVESLDKYGYPIAKLDKNGNPIPLGVERIKVPYLEREVKRMIKHLKKTRK